MVKIHKTKIDDEHEFCGSATLGERGQLVIPKLARRALGLLAGDSVVLMRNHQALILLPKKTMRKFVERMVTHLNLK